MAATTSSSSPQDQLIPTAVPKPSSAVSRRLPPPCWSPDETVALIDAYRDKWYALRRGNLRASHWQEVADDVAVRCPPSSLCPPKTSVQCRHKMEKLRKRYRAELQRASMVPSGHRFSSSWVHFKRMDSMEKGTSGADEDDGAGGNPMGDELEEEDEFNEEDDDEDLYQSVVKRGVPQNHRSVYGSMGNGLGSGVRIRYPGGPDLTPPTRSRMYNNFDGKPNPNSQFGSGSRVVRDEYPERLGGLGKRSRGYDDNGVGKKKEGNNNGNHHPVGELVEAIKSLGDGFVRMERMKMDMARELESMRMEMEMKRTDMILESQQQIVEAFAKAFSDKRIKKQKRMPSSDSQ